MKRKNIISLFMAVVMLLSFSVSAFAADVGTPNEPVVQYFEESGMKMTLYPADGDEIMPRTPGTAGLYSVVAAPASFVTGDVRDDAFVANYGGNGRTSFLHVTLDDAARRAYQAINADAYYVEVTFNLIGVTRYEVFLNGEAVGGNTCAGMKQGVLDFGMYDDRPAVWRVDLYDSTGAKMTWGHVNYM